jgi:hypothetical protein
MVMMMTMMNLLQNLWIGVNKYRIAESNMMPMFHKS